MNFMLKKLAFLLTPPLVWNFALKLALRFSKKTKQKCESELLHALSHNEIETPSKLALRGKILSVLHGPTFATIYREQFHDEIFKFEVSRSDPLILDCGANVGLVTLYMKTKFPEARIIAFEPDPACFQALRHNCSGLRDVKLIESAVWNSEGTRLFTPVGTVGGHLTELDQHSKGQTISVPTVRLRDFLQEDIEFLKMDIEGSEIDVLADCADLLVNVKYMFVEYHSFVDTPQRLAEMVGIIESAGFRMHTHGSMEERQPFMGVSVYNNKDFRLNFFCFRKAKID